MVGRLLLLLLWWTTMESTTQQGGPGCSKGKGSTQMGAPSAIYIALRAATQEHPQMVPGSCRVVLMNLLLRTQDGPLTLVGLPRLFRFRNSGSACKRSSRHHRCWTIRHGCTHPTTMLASHMLCCCVSDCCSVFGVVGKLRGWLS